MARARGSITFVRMPSSLGEFAPYVVPLLLGGLVASLVPAWVVRRPGVVSFLGRLGAGRIAILCLATVAVGALGAWFIIGDMLAAGEAAFSTVSPLEMFVLGLSVGLPLSVPGIAAGWTEARRQRRVAQKRRDHVPTKDERREFATRLADQIREVSPRPRDVTASISGDGGTVLLFEGDIDAKEGERLTAALRADLRDVGFKRVEGRASAGEWWTRV